MQVETLAAVSFKTAYRLELNKGLVDPKHKNGIVSLKKFGSRD